MCFSATAGFIAGTGLSVLGVATLRATRRKDEIPSFFVIALFSVWCFFAAIMSSIIYVHFSLAVPQPDVGSADR